MPLSSTLVAKLKTNRYGKERLNLDNCEPYLTSKDALQLFYAMRHNTKVKELNLYGNKIGDRGVAIIAYIPNIEKLDLGNNHISSEGIAFFRDSTVRNVSLRDNALGFDAVSEEDSYDVFSPFYFNKYIEELDLTNCNLAEKSVSDLIKYNRSLRRLNLNQNARVTDVTLKHIGKNNTLLELNLSETNITDKTLEFLIKNNSLQRLVFYKNNITDAGAALLSTHNSLKSLRIVKTNISENGMNAFLNSRLEEIEVTVGEDCYPCNYICEFQEQFKKTREEAVVLEESPKELSFVYKKPRK